MNRDTGFTLVELMSVVAIIGVMSATAGPFYNVYRQKAYNAEASMMAKSLLNGQISYFLEYNKFFPDDGQTIAVYHDNPSSDNIQKINDALQITIPDGHPLDYQIYTSPATSDDFCMIIISAPFPLFKNGTPTIWGKVDKNGEVILSTDEVPESGEEEEIDEVIEEVIVAETEEETEEETNPFIGWLRRVFSWFQ